MKERQPKHFVMHLASAAFFATSIGAGLYSENEFDNAQASLEDSRLHRDIHNLELARFNFRTARSALNPLIPLIPPNYKLVNDLHFKGISELYSIRSKHPTIVRALEVIDEEYEKNLNEKIDPMFTEHLEYTTITPELENNLSEAEDDLLKELPTELIDRSNRSATQRTLSYSAIISGLSLLVINIASSRIKAKLG